MNAEEMSGKRRGVRRKEKEMRDNTVSSRRSKLPVNNLLGGCSIVAGMSQRRGQGNEIFLPDPM